MKIQQVAAQLYTLRDFLKTPQQIKQTLKKVKQIGYDAVQISGMAPIPENDLNSMLKDIGLTCCATHEPADQILNEPQKAVEHLAKLGCKYTAYPYPTHVRLDSVKDVKEFAGKLNKSGKVLFESGIILTYHNHHIEFQRLDGKLILDILYDETDPKYIQGEIDTYWVQYGGGNPVEWCKKLKNRLPLLHMKDYKITKEHKIDYAEIGYGNLPWKEIVSTAEYSGCQWFIVEQDICPGDPIDSLQKSFEFIKTQLCA